MRLEFPLRKIDYWGGPQEARPAARPNQVWLPDVDFKDGETVGVVVLAETSIEVGFRVALRALGDGDQTTTAEQALEAFALRPPNRPEARFVGRGYQYASYFLVGGVPFASETYIGPVDVNRPSMLGGPVFAPAGPRLFDLSSSYTSPAGWAAACGILWAAPGAFSWSVDSTLRQASMEEARTHLEEPVVGPSNGFIFTHSGEGPGPSEAKYSLRGADASIVSFFGFEKLDVNATIVQLLGVEAESLELIREDSLPAEGAPTASVSSRRLAPETPPEGSYTYDNCLSERPIPR